MEYVKHIGATAAALLVAALGAGLVLRSWKWQWALRIHGLEHPLSFVTRLLFISFFLNNFLPTSVGGDAYRVFRTTPAAPPRSRGLSAVMLDRAVGFAVLLLLGLLCAAALYSRFRLARLYVALMLGLAVLAACAALVIRAYRLRRGDPRWMKSRWIAPLRENLGWIRRAHAAWAPLIGIALLFQAQAIVILWALFAALGAPIGLAQAGLIASAAGIAAVFPFSINGLGIAEASTAGAALALGATYESGLLASLLLRILVLPLTLLAGLLYAVEPFRRASAQQPLPPRPGSRPGPSSD
jgi:uncharacterized membrane protein YbhN (UPF0104 family)